jgi:hypothetical protein
MGRRTRLSRNRSACQHHPLKQLEARSRVKWRFLRRQTSLHRQARTRAQHRTIRPWRGLGPPTHLDRQPTRRTGGRQTRRPGPTRGSLSWPISTTAARSTSRPATTNWPGSSAGGVLASALLRGRGAADRHVRPSGTLTLRTARSQPAVPSPTPLLHVPGLARQEATPRPAPRARRRVALRPPEQLHALRRRHSTSSRSTTGCVPTGQRTGTVVTNSGIHGW